MRLIVAFLVGAVFGFIFPRTSPQAKNEVSVSCPSQPLCPAVTCQQDQVTLSSLTEHQKLLLRCYDEVSTVKKTLDDCRLDVLSLKAEADDWRKKYDDERTQFSW